MEVTSSLRSISLFQPARSPQDLRPVRMPGAQQSQDLFFLSSVMSAAVLETDKTTLNCQEGRNCHVTFGGEILNVTLTATQIS